ncbi:MAG: hypothetical protein MZV63_12790 [Marinilabiliales bacterium]|nr:hypothetical protein [Marinilabiliales bacterium]
MHVIVQLRRRKGQGGQGELACEKPRRWSAFRLLDKGRYRLKAIYDLDA